MPSWLKEYLSFNRTERNGILVLLTILLLVTGYHVYRQVFWQAHWQQTALEFGPSIVEFKQRMATDTAHYYEQTPWVPKAITLFNFDPNTLDSIGWSELGFSPKQVRTILNYRTKAGGFRKPEDLKKLFVISDEKYEQLQPFIRMTSVLTNTERTFSESGTREPWKKPQRETVIVEINSADSAQLTKLYGIGPSFAKRIVKYRQLLGGYRSVQQVLEVYGMDSARFSGIVQNLTVDTLAITRLNINLADEKELMRHPYISPNEARAIVSYRQQHGHYTSISQLKNIHIITPELLGRIAPYLTVQ